MQAEQFKILRAARAMGDFTKPELIRRAGVKDQALRSFFRRHGQHLFEATSEKRRAGENGNRANVWRIQGGKRDEIDAILDEGRAERRRTEMDPKAAARAMQDDHARWQARVSLFDAVDAPEGPSRQYHLTRCRTWLSHEERRLRHWSAAAEVPDYVTADLADLRRRVSAVETGVDRLAARDELRSFRGAVAWMIREAERFNHGTADAFAPLDLAGQKEPAWVLAEAALLCPEFDGPPRERLIIAAIAALPCLESGPARGLLCRMLDILGDKVGHALDEGLGFARPAEREDVRRMILAVLVGFQSFPELLKRSNFATTRRWYDNLPWTPVWDDEWAPFWTDLGRHTHKNCETMRCRLSVNRPIKRRSAAQIVQDFREIVGVVSDRVCDILRRTVEHYEDPPAPPETDWLTRPLEAA